MAGVGVGTGALGSVIGKLATLLGDEYKMLRRVRKDIQFLERELRRMQILVNVLADMEGLDEVAKDWKGSMRDLSYDMEECIDRFMLRLDNGEAKAGFAKRTARQFKTLFTRHGIGTQIKELKDRVEEESQRRQRLNLDNYIPATNVAIDPNRPAVKSPPVQAAAERSDMQLSPISASLGAMGSLQGKLHDLLATGHWALRGAVTDEIEQLATDLHTLHNLLVKVSNAQEPSVTARYWMKDVRELSYDVVDCADQFVRADDRTKIHRATRRKIIARLKINRLPDRRKWRPWITNKVSEFRIRAQEATRRYWRYRLDDCSSNLGYSCICRQLPTNLPDPGDLVGIEGPVKELYRRLASGEKQLKVVSIVGVGGIGKTTLAQKLWGKHHGEFECRAFVRIAHKPDMRGVIRSILSQVRWHQLPDAGDMHHLIRDLREYLSDKRYLVIIDDLWATSVWDVLSRAFPEGNCCSRIITTTEIMEVALACCSFCPEHILKMESLSDDDSEKLLLQRIHISGNQQFNNVLPQIKRNCGGLPLAIIIAASLLASQPEKLEQLGCTDNSFWANHTMQGFMGQILNISFNSLPHYLKTCLLYLSTYQESCLFLKGDLVKQWVAEGFIYAKEGEDMEEVAGSYFDELVSTGLIQSMDINYSYEVLSYSVHHMVHDLITYKSIEENFITVVDYSQTAMSVADKVRRLSLHFGSATYATTPASIKLSQVRSLFFSGLFNCVPSFMGFKLLRVLVLHIWGDTGNMSFNLEGICELFWLRYLQVACNVTVKLPDQIEPMKHLETLEINVGVCVVPPDIVRLPNLLHLRLQSGTNLPDRVGCMRSLRTLMYFDLGSSSEDNLWGLGELTNLQDLHLTYSSSPDSEHLKKKLIILATSLGKLGNLKSFTLASSAAGTVLLFDGSSSMFSTPVFLEKLELLPRICVFSRFPKWIGQLNKLCILKIAVIELLVNDIDGLTGLHSLRLLSLYVKTAPERRIVFNDGAFPVLKYFKFSCGVLCMSFMSGAMRNLRRLKLHFNTHIGEKYDNMLAGVEHLLNLQNIAGQIGATTESDRRASELVFKDAISNHPRCPSLTVKWVDPIEEEYHPSEKQHQSQERGFSGEKHGVLEKAEAANKFADDWLSQNSDQHPSVASCCLKSGSPMTTVAIDPRLSAFHRVARGLAAMDGRRDQVVSWLMEKSVELKVVAIVGDGGLGKTTLAMETYRKIGDHFQCRASVSMSRTLDPENLLKDLLSQIDQAAFHKCQFERWEEDKLVRQIQQILTGKRYFLVIDDVRKEQEWEFIKAAFPENYNGSRIIAITRITKVAKSCCSNSGAELYQMPPLSVVDSQRLFFKRIFGSDNSCPPQLEEVSVRIIRKCGGVPLAIVTIASLLANKPQNPDEWERLQASIGTSLSYESDNRGKGMREILLLSYWDLPHHLKTCLLYLCIYPEDWHISCEELKWKWIAEGFIVAEQGNLYQEAESCFNELVNRSMIRLVDDDDDDGLKQYCQVHDIVLDLIISLSDGENFATILNYVHNSLPSRKIRRLSIQSSGLDLKRAIHEMTRSKLHVRSLHVFVEAKEILPLVDFQSLRVFDTCVGHWLWKNEHIINIGSFYQLRYLRIQGRGIEELPENIGKLQNLETLDLRGTSIGKLPPTIARLTKLVRLFIEHNYDVVFPADMFGSMQALEEVSDIGRVDNPEKFLAELAHRKKLRKISMNYLWIGNGDQDNIRGYRERLASSLNELCNKHNLRYLHSHGHMGEYLFSGPHTFERLQHLKLDVYYMERLPRGMASLTNILKLEIMVELFDEEGLNILRDMPYLTYLQVEAKGSNVGTVSSEGFKPLEVFHHETRFGGIKFAAGAMPALRRLHLSCSPSADTDMGIEHLSSLAYLQLKTDCIGESRHSVEALEDSVRKAVALHPNRHALQLHVNRSFESDLL